MDFWFMLVFGLLIHCDTEGCSGLPPLSLSSFPGGPPLYFSTLMCHLCLNTTKHPSQLYTFTFSLNGHLISLFRRSEGRALYVLDKKKNNIGLWKCKVDEYPDLSAEYYLGPPTSAPPAEKKRDTSKEEPSVPAYIVSYRIILTIVTAAALLITLIIVTATISSRCVTGPCRKTSPQHADVRGRGQSDNFLLTEKCNSDTSDPKVEPDAVSYVELEVMPMPPLQKTPSPRSTIYATIM
ncbi:uncharacterized protein LOC142102065 isoform X2 [Mixophyes fleayi]|uniref:uncharacterized protein LOC142102065 isoform X2 n=1 Tax=Mixophyes fleayi TaxID=3061075 RepID=UPI003F4DAF61